MEDLEDHPRRCGENALEKLYRLFDMGSPPQVRGKRFFKVHVVEPCRITPAGAGKTLSAHRHTRRNGDHPRRCGENRLIEKGFCNRAGSPPQVRGKRIDIQRRSGERRITPAGAGKTHLIPRLRSIL